MSIEYKPVDPARPARIAIREEGEWVNAYLVVDMLKFQKHIGAVLLDSINADKPLFEEFKALMSRHIVRWMTSINLDVGVVEERKPDA